MTTAAKNRLNLGTALLITSLLAGDNLLGEAAQAPAPERKADQISADAGAPIARGIVPFADRPVPHPAPIAIKAPRVRGTRPATKALREHRDTKEPVRILAGGRDISPPPPETAAEPSTSAKQASFVDAESPEAVLSPIPAVLARWREPELADADAPDLDIDPGADTPASPEGVVADPPARSESTPAATPAAPVDGSPAIRPESGAAPAPDPIAAKTQPLVQPASPVTAAGKRIASARARALREAKAGGLANAPKPELSALIASTEALKALTSRTEVLPRERSTTPPAANDPGDAVTASQSLPDTPAARGTTGASVGPETFRRSIAAARAALGEPARVPEPSAHTADVAAPGSGAIRAANDGLPVAANDLDRATEAPRDLAPVKAPSDFRRSIAAARAALGEPARATPSQSSLEATPPGQDNQTRPRINSYGREVTLDFPLEFNGAPLGDVPLRIALDDSLSISPEALVALLSGKVDARIVAQIVALPRIEGMVALDQVRATGVELRFDIGAAKLYARTAPERGSETEIALAHAENAAPIGTFTAPAGFSGYLNLATGIGYEAAGRSAGVAMPILAASVGVRLGGLVFESDFTSDFGTGRRFTRGYSRLVFDQPGHDRRFVAGDIFASSTGLLSAPSLLGIGVERRVRMFDPSRNIRPQSYQSFALNNPSQVDVVINGVTVRRLSLAPGSYRLSDFPFVSGANDVQIVATDSFGRRDVADFSSYFDFSLLQPGLDEFSVNAGFLATQGSSGPQYDFSRPTGNFSYRRGLTQWLTLGGGIQGDRATQAASLRANVSTRLGNVLTEASVSNSRLGFGYAGRLIYQYGGARLGDSGFSGLGVSVDYTSRGYANVSIMAPEPSINALRVSATTSFRLGRASYVTAGGAYATRRNGRPDSYEASVRLSQRLDRSTYLSLGGGYERSQANGRGAFFQIGLTRRFGGRGYGSVDYDSRTGRGRLNYSNAGTGNAGDFNANGSLNIGRNGISGNGSLLLRTSHAEFGLNEGMAYDMNGRRIVSSRTNATVATSLLFADGSFAIGRPVTDSFAIVRAHSTLKSAAVYIDHRDQAYLSRSGRLGPAAITELASYSERTITVDVPDAPIGYDLGTASFRVRPPYRAGYKLTIGSEFTLTAMGYLKENGQPILLAMGRAMLIGDPQAPVVDIFTDRAGRFGASGLKPGRYRIELGTAPPLTFEMVIPAGTQGLVRVGDLEAI